MQSLIMNYKCKLLCNNEIASHLPLPVQLKLLGR